MIILCVHMFCGSITVEQPVSGSDLIYFVEYRCFNSAAHTFTYLFAPKESTISAELVGLVGVAMAGVVGVVGLAMAGLAGLALLVVAQLDLLVAAVVVAVLVVGRLI